MDIIFGEIGIGGLVGIGLYIGFEGMNALIETSAGAISFILRKTLETRKFDDEWSAGQVAYRALRKIKNFFARDF